MPFWGTIFLMRAFIDVAAFLMIMALLVALPFADSMGWIGSGIGSLIFFLLIKWISEQPPRWKQKENNYSNYPENRD